MIRKAAQIQVLYRSWPATSSGELNCLWTAGGEPKQTETGTRCLPRKSLPAVPLSSPPFPTPVFMPSPKLNCLWLKREVFRLFKCGPLEKGATNHIHCVSSTVDACSVSLESVCSALISHAEMIVSWSGTLGWLSLPDQAFYQMQISYHRCRSPNSLPHCSEWLLSTSQTPCSDLCRSATANVQSLYQSWETVGRTGMGRPGWSSQPAGSRDAGRGAGSGVLKSHKTEGAAELKV